MASSLTLTTQAKLAFQSFRRGISRRMWLLFFVNALLNTLVTIIISGGLRFQAIRRLHSAINFLVISLVMLGPRHFMYIDMAMHTNRDLRRLRMFLLVILPLILGSALGYLIFKVSVVGELSSVSSPHSKKLLGGFLHPDAVVSIVASISAYGMWNYRYYRQNRADYWLPIIPSTDIRTLLWKLASLSPTALWDSFYVSGILISVSAVVQIILVRLLGVQSVVISLLFPITSAATCYRCFNVALLVTLLLGMCETMLKLFVLHPIKFYRLGVTDEESDRSSTLAHSKSGGSLSPLACAVCSVCPLIALIGSERSEIAAAAVKANNQSEDDQIFNRRRINKAAPNRSNNRNNNNSSHFHRRGKYIWESTLEQQMTIESAVLSAVRPTGSGKWPQVPSIYSLSTLQATLKVGSSQSINGHGIGSSSNNSTAGIYGSFTDGQQNDDVMVVSLLHSPLHVSKLYEESSLRLMQALAMQDFSRSARQIHGLARSLDLLSSAGSGVKASKGVFVDVNLVDASSWVETATRHLQSEEWHVIAMSACTLIDTVALQFQLATAFTEDIISRQQLIADGLLYDAPMVAISEILIGKPRKTGERLLDYVYRVIEHWSPSTVVPSANSEVHVAKNCDPLVPSIVSSSHNSAADSNKAANSHELNNIKRFSVAATIKQIVNEGKDISKSTMLGQLGDVFSAWIVRSESLGVELLTPLIGLSNSKWIFDILKGIDVPLSPVPAATLQTCIHAIEGLTLYLAASQHLNHGGNPLEFIATSLNSLLSLATAVRAHKEAIRKFYYYTSPSYRMQRLFIRNEVLVKEQSQHRGIDTRSGQLKGVTGGKKYLGNQGVMGDSSLGMMAQPSWTSSETRALAEGIDEGFFRLFSQFSDAIPQFSFSASNLNELRQKLEEWRR